jgi:hypothetical protein
MRCRFVTLRWRPNRPAHIANGSAGSYPPAPVPQRTTSNEPAALETPPDAGTWHASSPNGRQRDDGERTPRLRWRIGVSLILLAGAALATALFASEEAAPPPGPVSPSGPAALPLVAFKFALIEVNVVRTVEDRGRASAARGAVEGVRTTLSQFYATAFLDPATWKGGTPDALWSMFGSDIRATARTSAASFTLGRAAGQVGTLSSSSSSIGVTIFFDPSGHVHAASATVVFGASGELVSGSPLSVTSTGMFLLKLQGGRWLIVGYPAANTDVDATPAPSSTPSPTGGASGSASEGGGG